MDTVKIYRDDIDFSSEFFVINMNNAVDTTRGGIVSRLISICSDCVILARLHDKGFNINQIDIDNVLIDGNKGFFDDSIVQNFGVKKSYVATVDKDFVNGVISFYSLIDNRENNDYLFDGSQDLKSQRIVFVRSDDFSSEEDDKKVEKKQGRFKVFLLGIIAAAMLTIMSVMIGMKILGIK